MKLKTLTIALLGLNFVACAHQPIGKNVQLSQKVYQGYEHLVSDESYAYNGKMSFYLDGIETSPQNKSQPQQPTPEQETRQKVLLESLQKPEKITTQQQQWMKEGLDHVSVTAPKSEKMAQTFQTFFNRFYYSYDGVMDLKRGQMSFNPKMGYESRNAQAWMSFPMALDLKNNNIYADISALSPLLTDPQYDGRYVVFNYTELLGKGINQRPLLEFMRDWMLINAALAKESDYQTIALTADDKQQGGVERIRYNVSFAELMAQYALYTYLNADYLKTIIKNEQDTAILEKLNPVQGALTGNINSLVNTDINQLLKVDSTQSAEKQATARISSVIDALSEQYAEANLAEYATEAATEAYAEAATDAASNTDDIAEEAMDAVVIAEEATDESITLPKDDESVITILGKFDAYKQPNKIITALEVKQIIEKESESYQQLIQDFSQSMNSVTKLQDSKYTSDLTFDRQGRIVRNELKMSIGGFDELGFKRIGATMVGNIGQYGQAQINQQSLKNAVNFRQAANENTSLNLGSLMDEWLDKTKVTKTPTLNSKDWDNHQRYEKLAESLLAQNTSFIDAYTTVYRYAYILESDDVLEDDVDFTQLDNTGRWNAIYYAREEGLPVTEKQLQEFDDSPDDWQHYDEELSETIWEIFKDLAKQQKYVTLYQKLNSQYKSDAALFSAMYLAIETENELKNSGRTTVEFPEQFLSFVQVLGEIAAEDLKTQKVNAEKLAVFSSSELMWFEADIYEQVYRQVAKR